MPRFAMTSIIIVLCLFAAGAFAEEKPIVIRADQAREHLGKPVVVTFNVQSSKVCSSDEKVNAGCLYLDSEKNFRDYRNLGVFVLKEVREKLERDLETTDLPEYFVGKEIKVVGTPVERERRIYLDISDFDQLTIIDAEKEAETESEQK